MASVPPVDDLMLSQDFFWEENKNKIFAAVAAFLVLAFGVIGWIAWTQHRKGKAEEIFSSASTPEQWKEVIRAYPGTPVADNSSLLLAAALRKSGDLQGSTKVYQEALLPKNPYGLRSAAALGIAENALLASGGKFTPDAVAALRAVSENFPDSYAAAFSLFLRGDLLLNEGKELEALQVFRELLASYPDALFGKMASGQVQELAMKQAVQAPAEPQPAPPASLPPPADVPPPPAEAPAAP